ncbi:phage integrase family protein [Variovorax sp. CY25R-8]|uniref:phage integrase family protein n=1 Tax=Variovorax sp. CY25R-8 TaxID=2855501 RepID=UPI0021BBB3EE|nr:phage integrase family protein [Variovorax sp. CY25R-8]MCT8178907.1 hypothetical protein [Variovorax sp. CY25R-8]
MRSPEAKFIPTLDAIADWLPKRTAALLERSDIRTIQNLLDRIVFDKRWWWKEIKGLGVKKSQAVVECICARSNELRLPKRIIQLLNDNKSIELWPEAPRTAIVPLEYLMVPTELNGQGGDFRTLPGQCLLKANDDLAAIGTWLGNYQNSFLSYRRQAERLLLWSIFVRKKALSSLTEDDALAYKKFLTNPPIEWCGPRHCLRRSTEWRPFEGPIRGNSLNTAIRSINSLYRYLKKNKYLANSPFDDLCDIKPNRAQIPASRALTLQQWKSINGAISTALLVAGDHEPTRRVARTIRWIYATGLSSSEMASVECGALRPVEFGYSNGTLGRCWVASVLGRRSLLRHVLIPTELIRELEEELARAGRPSSPTAAANKNVAILAQFSVTGCAIPPPSSISTLQKSVCRFMVACASRMEDPDAAIVRRVTPTWLRNTHSAHITLGHDLNGDSPALLHHVAVLKDPHDSAPSPAGVRKVP